MDKYRVIVMREGTTEDETLFEIAGSAALVQGIVPGVLDTVLGSQADEAARSLADRVFDGAVAAGTGAEQQGGAPKFADAEPVKQTRNRRTKAQIAADKEAQDLGFRDAAHRAEVEAQQQVHPGGPDPSAVPAEPVAAPVPPVAETPPPATPVQAPAGEPAAAPWNPFVQPTH
jgi:hypothetical protein